MKVLKIIGIIIAALVVIIVVLGLIADKNYAFKRNITINAPQEVIYNNVRLYENFDKWEPWGKYDEGKAKITREGTDGTIGAKRSWEGPKTGSGSMTIAVLEENKSVTWDLLVGPFSTPNKVQVSITPAEGGQQVEWSINGTTPFPFNGLSLFYSMEKAMGKDFEDGLQSLKTLSEAGNLKGTTAYKIDEIDWTEKKYLSHREIVKEADLPTFFNKHFTAIYSNITKAKAQPGIPVGVYYDFDMATGIADVAAAVPTDKVPFPLKDNNEYKALTIPAGKAYKVDYYGPYGKEMEKAYTSINGYVKDKFNREKPDLVVEEYVGDPMTEKDPSKLHTVIYFFVNDKTAAK